MKRSTLNSCAYVYCSGGSSSRSDLTSSATSRIALSTYYLATEVELSAVGVDEGVHHFDSSSGIRRVRVGIDVCPEDVGVGDFLPACFDQGSDDCCGHPAKGLPFRNEFAPNTAPGLSQCVRY